MLSGNLPQDLVIEILSRTPATSLVRFNLVSKSWRDLFQESSFIMKHKKTRSANNGCCFFARQIYYGLPHSGKRYCLLQRDGETAARVRDEDLVPFSVDFSNLLLLAAADDILFVRSTNFPKAEYLWNPTTREFRKVPSFIPDPDAELWFNLFGLGYDFKSNDVKVVTTFTDVSRRNTSRTSAAVWSSRTGSWREIINPEIPHHQLIRDEQLFVGGKCYWHINNLNSLGLLLILSFDFSDEKFQLIPLPDDLFVQGCDGMMIAAELKQSIGYAVFQPDGECRDEKVTIWLMSNEKPVSWYKYITLTTPYLRRDLYLTEKWLVCFETEVVIIGSAGNVFFHNLITSKIMSSRIMHSDSIARSYFGLHVYRESMVLFKDGKM